MSDNTNCDCKTEEGILNKSCLKEKLEEWFDLSVVYDLFYESGNGILGFEEKYKKFDFEEHLLLFVIRNLFIRRFRDRIKNSNSITIHSQLNNCCLLDNSKYKFDEYGVLEKIIKYGKVKDETTTEAITLEISNAKTIDDLSSFIKKSKSESKIENNIFKELWQFLDKEIYKEDEQFIQIYNSENDLVSIKDLLSKLIQ